MTKALNMRLIKISDKNQAANISYRQMRGQWVFGRRLSARIPCLAEQENCQQSTSAYGFLC